MRTIRTADGVTRFETQEISATFDLETEEVTVIINGEKFVLTQNPNSDELTYQDADNFVVLDEFAEVRGASGFENFAVLDDELNESYIVIGLDTSPSEVAALSGNATFSGSVIVSLRRDAFFDAFGSGEFELVANFDDNTIGGTATIIDDNAGNADFNFDDITLDLEDTSIDENGFAGGISVTSGDIEGELVSGGYDGRFFGEDAVSAGGNLYGRVDVDGSDTDTFINGFFLGEDIAND